MVNVMMSSDSDTSTVQRQLYEMKSDRARKHRRSLQRECYIIRVGLYGPPTFKIL